MFRRQEKCHFKRRLADYGHVAKIQYALSRFPYVESVNPLQTSIEKHLGLVSVMSASYQPTG